jgi:hypothetical protein
MLALLLPLLRHFITGFVVTLVSRGLVAQTQSDVVVGVLIGALNFLWFLATYLKNTHGVSVAGVIGAAISYFAAPKPK